MTDTPTNYEFMLGRMDGKLDSLITSSAADRARVERLEASVAAISGLAPRLTSLEGQAVTASAHRTQMDLRVTTLETAKGTGKSFLTFAISAGAFALAMVNTLKGFF